MLAFITENLGTIIISAVLIGVVALIVARLVINRRRSKTACSCGCDGCPSAGVCHDRRDK